MDRNSHGREVLRHRLEALPLIAELGYVAAAKDVSNAGILGTTVHSILTGVRIGMGIGWMILVAAEFTGVRQGYGLGYMIMTARDIQRADEMLAGMAVIGLIGLLIDHTLRHLEGRLARWR